jgi:alpha-L-fucosidase
LLGLGKWLNVNGEAIYGAHHWETFGEGTTTVGEGHMREREDQPFSAEDIRFTTKNDALYATCLGWPGEAASIRSLGGGSSVKAGMIERIQMLGSDEQLVWSQDDDSLQIKSPSQKPCDHAYTFKIVFKHVS